MKKQATFLFYLLGAYVVLQFSWWAYHIIQLTKLLGKDEILVSKKIGMIVGEGLVFFMILIFGIWRIIRSIKKENELALRQHNFLLSVTHELKTPLASTKLYIQTLLKRTFEKEKQDELLNKALLENKRLEEIVDAILISAKIENRSFEIHREKIQVFEVIEEICSNLNHKIGKNNLHFEGTNELVFYSDLFMFRTILINLMENALKYAGQEQKIEILLEKKTNHFSIQVKDLGPGIPKEKRELIFHKFVRLENEETRSTKGTGLGLFIVKEFTAFCGGSILYKENIPQGAIFEITFPFAN